MESITFTCVTITPLVMNGPYGNNDPELRPSGIKASLRFWWRALNGHLKISDLREKEGKIFGNTKGKSKVIIRIEEPIPTKINEKTFLLPHNVGSHNKNKRPSPAAAYITGLSFKIRIDFDENVISTEKIKNLFVLSCALGGWGKRSRRGFGSVMVMEVNGQAFVSPTSINDIYNLLDKNYFVKANDTINSNFRRNEAYPYLKSIEIGEQFNSEFELREKIGSSSSMSKRENNDSWDYRNSLGHTSKRFASPYCVSVIRIGDEFSPIYTSLNIATERGNKTPRNAKQIQNDFKNRIL